MRCVSPSGLDTAALLHTSAAIVARLAGYKGPNDEPLGIALHCKVLIVKSRSLMSQLQEQMGDAMVWFAARPASCFAGRALHETRTRCCEA